MSNTGLAAVTPTLSNKAYDALKFVALVLLPAAAVLYFALGNLWGWPKIEQTMGTITAIDTFLGILLGINNKVYRDTEPSTDGQIVVTDTGEGLILKLQPNKNPSTMVNQEALVFKVVHVPPTPEEQV